MRRWTIQFIGGIVGIASFLVAPNNFKFLGFFFSTFCFAISLRDENNYFNIHVFLITIFIFVLLSASLFTFDTSSSTVFDMNANTFISYVGEGAQTITIIICIGVPILLIVSGIYAFILGNGIKGMRSVVYALVFISFVVLVSFIFKSAGIWSFGIADWILDFYSELISFFFELPISIYENIDQALVGTNMNIDLPDIPANKHFRQPKEPTQPVITGGGLGGLGGVTGGTSGGTNIFTNNPITDTISKTKIFDSNMSTTQFMYAMNDSLPFLVGMINLVSVIFFKNRKWEEILVSFFNYFSEEDKRKVKKKKTRVHLPNADYTMIGYALILMASGFFVFLAYTNSYGVNTREDWRYIMFIYYMVISLFSIYYLQRLHNYTPAYVVDTIKGTVYGVAGLWVMTRAFFREKVFSAFSAVDMHNNVWYAYNTFIFIAPAETLMFSLLIPCFVLAILQKKAIEARGIQVSDVYSIPQEMARLTNEIGDFEDEKNRLEDDKKIWEKIDGAVIQSKKNKKRHIIDTKKVVGDFEDKISKINSKIAKHKRDLRELEKIEFLPLVNKDSILARPIYLTVFFIVGIIGSSFIFASAHWVVISNEISYDMFWLCGLGVLYFAGGVWFCVIGVKYGWLSAILCHAIYNTSSILTVIALSG